MTMGFDLFTLLAQIFHELQPLDINVIKSFKIILQKFWNIWNLTNKHKSTLKKSLT
jgi:hypothetical protein